ncbi:MAG: DUF72 domain-containing protein [Armatimonadetes bacterium]|nr:DUF72 domain-containing protein [Armatimonadota bacterium]
MIRVGVCGFSFKDWKGPVYPEHLKESEYLSYYNQVLKFDTVEIDVSYYTYLSQKTAARWVEKTTDDFGFAVKCHKEMTLNEMGKVDFKILSNEEAFSKFLFTFEPLMASRKLLCFLAQFGPLFWKSEAHKEYLSLFRERMAGYPLVVEFRHKSWLSKEGRDDTFAFLEANRMAYATVDEPQIRQLVPLVPAITDAMAYFRLHGRNAKAWFKGSREERYNYLYNEEELRALLPVVALLSRKASTLLVMFNNCHAGAAFHNAVMMKELLRSISPP